ncbi:prophage integrase [Janthinobacterium sp. Marseille]|uniref:Tyrosine-type recombinase/integrase n=1 Tax=Herminiimonas aquatilis TaxID=345342 RepID=A0ABW2J5F4_9BURK|nr:integrase arm-type DNA-binding domain-containing protein [Janthinobacterium sp. Marseille]ABR91695.1 prophage integrase [Janthinobacterium sp. Marseille]
MPKLATPLTDLRIKAAKPKEKPYQLADGEGMYLEILPSGSKVWRMAYRQENRTTSTRLTFGHYPAVGLAEARRKRADTKKQIVEGVDPAQARRVEKAISATAAANTFEAVARMWHQNKLEQWQPRTANNILRRLEQDVFPLIGKRPIAEVKAPVMLDVLRQIEKRGAAEIARRNAQVCSQIFRYAIACGIAENDPVPALRGALKPRIKGVHAAILVAELPEFLETLNHNKARMFPVTRILMQLMMLTFVRTSELTETPWSEVDLKNEQWVIPWQRMKMGKRKINPRKVDHHVFLPKQGWAFLRELRTYTGGNQWLFPNQRDPKKPISNGAILAALKRLGYAGKHTGHGFRSLAKGILKTLGNDISNIERQLAHSSGEAYGASYDRESFLEERKIMMQGYADYIDAVSRKIGDSN